MTKALDLPHNVASVLLKLDAFPEGMGWRAYERTVRYLRDLGLVVTCRDGRFRATHAGQRLAREISRRRHLDALDRNGHHFTAEELAAVARFIAGTPERFDAEHYARLRRHGIFDESFPERVFTLTTGSSGSRVTPFWPPREAASRPSNSAS